MIDLKKFFRESLLLRFCVGVSLILLGVPWYWNPIAVFITLLGAAILIFVRVETFKKANENFHKNKKPPPELD
jgi:Flp pilus assembly protein TadB